MTINDIKTLMIMPSPGLENKPLNHGKLAAYHQYFQAESRVHVQRRLHEAVNPAFQQCVEQADGHSIMLMCVFCYSSQLQLVKMASILTGVTYTDLLADHVNPFMLVMFAGGDDCHSMITQPLVICR